MQTATEPGADYRNRIFTVVGELPFAGHPSLGTAVAVAAARDRSQQRGTRIPKRRVSSFPDGEASVAPAAVLCQKDHGSSPANSNPSL